MRLPTNLRVRWYEHIDGHAERATLALQKSRHLIQPT